MSAPVTIHVDGASRGNPGPAAFAVVIRPPGAAPVEVAETLGTTTNNVAEYTALVSALHKAHEMGLSDLQVFSDSELMVKQMNGQYRVKSPDLQDLYREAMELRKQFRSVTLTHVRREQNRRADELCNLVLDGKLGTSPAVQHPPKPPAPVVGDDTVRADALECLAAAARSWADRGPNHPPVAQVWDQLWSILRDGNVLKKRKS